MKEEMNFVFTFGNEKVDELMRTRIAEFEQDTEVMARVNKAETMDEFYDAALSYIKVTFEEFKQSVMDLTAKAENAFNEAFGNREELNDEELDHVIGGGFGSWFKKHWKKIATVAIGASLAAAAFCTGGAALAGLVPAMAATKTSFVIGAITCSVGAGAYKTAQKVID